MKKRNTERPSPRTPPKYEIPDVEAIQALSRGEASPEQQQRALKWIAESAAAMYDLPYFDGVGGDRDTAFGCGRMFVGHQIRKLTKLSVGELKTLKQNEETR